MTGGHGWDAESCCPAPAPRYRAPTLADFTAHCEKLILDHDARAAALATQHDRWEERRHHRRMAKAYRDTLTIVGAFLS